MSEYSLIVPDWELFRKPPVYAFLPNKGGKLRWLQRLLFSVLRRLGCEQDVAIREYRLASRTITFDVSKMIDAITAQCRSIDHWYVSGYEPRYLVVGPKQFVEIACGTADSMRSTSNLTDPVKFRLHGMDVVVLPWIDGIFALPNLERI